MGNVSARMIRGRGGITTGRAISKRRSGFTIIELAVVIALISLLTAIAVFKLRGPYQKAQLASSIHRIEQLDRLVRSRARQQQTPSRITIDLKRGMLQAFDNVQSRKPLAQVSLAMGGRIDRVISGGRTTRSGVTTIRVGSRGQSPSYALRLMGSNDERTWLLFAARTGQLIELESDREVGKLMLSKRATGADSD